MKELKTYTLPIAKNGQTMLHERRRTKERQEVSRKTSPDASLDTIKTGEKNGNYMQKR